MRMGTYEENDHEFPKEKSEEKNRITEISGIFSSIGLSQYEAANDCPIEEVRLTVPITDDKDLPVLTFRMWVLGLTSCAFLNQFFNYLEKPLTITSISAQIVVLPLGKLMAATLPEKSIRIPLTGWSFSLNPAFQHQRALLDHHFCQCGCWGSLCSQYNQYS
ncbi:Oligopeptide transporter 5 [Acorus calamus]|uniref:Oligopeptide transporter 5 n=1 Tax=Acorus calamus TaxID=4465 RepID=A0AAV9EVN2_ACOCL|nr:Oligopeptide transporter 5 [Acorus calamus]